MVRLDNSQKNTNVLNLTCIGTHNKLKCISVSKWQNIFPY